MKDISKLEGIKRGIINGVVPTVLAGSLVFSNGGIIHADAFAFEEPKVTYEEFIKDSNIKVFINGRLVEFSDDMGYPYAENGRTYIPLRAVAEAFRAYVGWMNTAQRVYVNKHDRIAELVIGEDKIKIVNGTPISDDVNYVPIDTKAVVKNGRTYIPLRAMFECFGLSVRWDGNTNSAHIETLGDNIFPNIDFKSETISIKDLDVIKLDEVIYDGVSIDKSYVQVLKNSDQYKVLVDNNKAYIFSYGYLAELDYLYGKEDYYRDNMFGDKFVIFRSISEEEFQFFRQFHRTASFEVDYSYRMNLNDYYGPSYYITPSYDKDEYNELMKIVKEIVSIIKSKTNDPREQVILANKLILERVKFDDDGVIAEDAYDAFTSHKGTCGGFQSAFQIVMNELEIPCVSQSGRMTANMGGYAHGWNQVYIDGEWYIVDVYQNSKYGEDSFLFVSLDDTRASYMVLEEQVKNDLDLIKLTYRFD